MVSVGFCTKVSCSLFFGPFAITALSASLLWGPRIGVYHSAIISPILFFRSNVTSFAYLAVCELLVNKSLEGYFKDYVLIIHYMIGLFLGVVIGEYLIGSIGYFGQVHLASFRDYESEQNKLYQEFFNKMLDIFNNKLKGREHAKSLFINSAGSRSFFEEVFELPISYANIQILNNTFKYNERIITGYEFLENQIRLMGTPDIAASKLLASLKAVEHFIYLRDVIFRCYESSYLPFMSVALKNPNVNIDLQCLHFADYSALKVLSDEALSNQKYQYIAAKPKITKPTSFVDRYANCPQDRQFMPG